MTDKEAKEMFEEMRGQGYTDDDILGALYLLYQDEELDTESLRKLLEILGYEFSEDFEKMSEEDKHKKGLEFPDGEDPKEKEEVKKEEVVEEKKDDDAPKADKEEKVEDKKEEVKEEVKEDGKDDKKVEEIDEKEEERRAMKMFGLAD